MANIYDMADTWNNVATTFTAIKMDVTDTASASGSLLMDLQVGTSSKFSVNKKGGLLCARSGNAYLFLDTEDLQHFNAASVRDMLVGGNALGVALSSHHGISWGNSTTAPLTKDLYLTRKGTANLRFGPADAAAPVAQTLSVQSVTGVADTAGADFTIEGSQGTGTGAGGSILFKLSSAGTAGTGQNGFFEAMKITFGNAAGRASIQLPQYSTLAPLNGRLGISAGGNIKLYFEDGVTVYGNGKIGFSSGPNTTGLSSATDTAFFRDGPGQMALRNGANAQTFRVYNTYNGTNDEWGTFDFSTQADQLTIGSMKSGSGQSKSIRLVVGGTRVMISDGSFVQVDKDLYPTQNIIMASKYTEMAEMTAPAAPATNKVRIYAEDNGAGKTRLMALFPTGAAQQIAIEP